MRSNQVIIVLGVATLLSLSGCVNREAQQQSKRTTEQVTDKRVPISVASVTRKSLTEFEPITGQLTTDAETKLGAKISGKLTAVYVREGDKVTAGQIVAQLDTASLTIQLSQAASSVSAAQAALNQAVRNARITPDRSAAAVSQARANLKQAQAQLQKALAGARPEEKAQAEAAVRAARSNMQTAKTNRDRQANLFREGATSQQALDAAENAYQAALAQYEQAVQALNIANNAVRAEDIETARMAVAQAEEGVRSALANQKLDELLQDQVASARAQLDAARAQYRLANQALEDAKIRASFSGTVLGQPLQVGTIVSPGTPVVTIIGESGLYFEGDVPAALLSKATVGAPVTITVDGVEGSFIGRLESVSPAAANVGRVFRARIKFASSNPSLKAGLFARGLIKVREAIDVLSIPTSAIQSRGVGDVVFVVDGDKVREVKVKRGLTQNGYTQILGEVKEGDKVATVGVEDLQNNSPIILTKESNSSQTPAATTETEQ